MVLDDSGWQLPAFDLTEYSARRNDYCVCIPVINEGERIRTQIRNILAKGIPNVADVFILDGGSTDGSLDQDFLRSHDIAALLVKRSPGKLSAQLRMGYGYALRKEYKGIITIDGNGKDGVDGVFRIIEKLRDGVDLVQGSRYLPGAQALNTPLIRHLGSRLIHAPILSMAAGFHYTDTTNGFRGYSRKLMLDPRVQPFRDIFMTYELLAYMTVRAPQLGFRVVEVPVVRAYPKSGKVPTKISAVSGNLLLLEILFKAAFGAYNPNSAA
jgi:dolichol-phosphate mannosyltransferase